MATIKYDNGMNLRNEARNFILDEIQIIKKSGSDKLPPERDLSQKYNISRVTLRSALADLEREGKIVRRQGSGTFISPNFQDMKADLFRMKTYSQMILEDGYKLKVCNLESKMVKTPDFIKKIGIYKNENMLLTSRAYYADEVMAAVCIDYLEDSFEKDLDNISKYQDSIFKYLYEKYEIELSAGSIQFHATDSKDIENYISISNILLPDKCLLIEGIEYDLSHKPIIFTREYVNTDIIHITTVRRR